MEKTDLLFLTTILTLVTWTLASCAVNVEVSINCKREELKGDFEQRCSEGYEWLCNNMSLSEVPKVYPEYNASSKLCLLDLSLNNLTNIPNNSFKSLTDLLWLWLDENDLTRIDSDAFAGLHNLICLDLSTNSLQYPKSFANDVLKPLEKLEGLSLKNNPIESYERLEDLLYPLKNLKELCLTGCYNCSFGKGFRNFTKLTKLSLSGYPSAKYACNISILFKETFINLPSLDSLKLSFCNISQVKYGALRQLKNLQNLTISHNPDLHFKGLKNVLSDLANSSLQLLDVSAIHEQFEQGTVLLKQDVEPIKYLKDLMFLHMDFNKLEVIEEEVFDLIPEKLIHFWLSGNRLTYGKYVEKVSSMANIRYLDLSRQNLNFDPLLQKHPDRLFGVSHQDTVYQSYMRVSKFDSELSGYYDKELINMNAFQTSDIDTESVQIEVYDSQKRLLAPKTLAGGLPVGCVVCQFLCKLLGIPCICAPEKLQNVMWRASFVFVHIHKLMICKPNRLRKMDLSFNLLEEWIGPVYGLEKLEEINLAENVCYKMSSFFFENFHGLRKLNISYNYLRRSLDPEKPEAGTHFKNLKKVQTFDLSGNAIEALASDTFENMDELQYLYVKQNRLTQWNCTLNTRCLRLLDLSDNKIETLSKSFRDYLDSLAALSPEESCNRTSRLKFRLGGNPIQCNCDNRPFLRWLSDSPVCVEFYMWDECHLQNGRRVQLLDSQVIPRLVDRLDRECVPYVFIGTAIGIFLISIGLCIVVYRFRWKLRHLYYSKRRRHQLQGYDRIFERDAFISYAKTEVGFIKDKLIPSLEEDCGLKVWIADRDSLPGASIAENLTHAIYSSRKSILILSRRYFVESWCNYEMNMARIESIESQRKLLIIVLYEDISAKDMPLDYLRLLKTAESIEYPKHPQHHDTFWTSLARAIHESDFVV